MVEAEDVDLFLPGGMFRRAIIFRRNEKTVELFALVEGILYFKYIDDISLIADYFP
jgi:hypothetical protein